MNSEEAKALCLALLHADSEEQVIDLLKTAGFWDRPEVWRLYGGRDGNYATIGNQQSRPDAALVEKIVNSVDARLMNECLRRGILPTSQNAPQSIRHAVSAFFEEKADAEIGGVLQRWSAKRRSEESQYITLAATGPKRRPCLTLVDTGEGQSPGRMHDTFLSIDKENKLRIPFVQGKFNMGGTGVLKFCGEDKLQLIITRRNPDILAAMGETDETASQWGFTVVRRERPTQLSGAVKNSVYTYLAPLYTTERPRRGEVLRFSSNTLPLMPKHNKPYVREISSGSAIKLYNYDMKGFSSHILMKDGLLYRLEILLPEIALPVSLHECRDYSGKSEASFVTPLSGLVVRLEEGKGGNIEEDFPTSVPFSVHGQSMTAKIYAFKDGRAETYRTNEGVIFTINGQTHGTIPKTIFQRKSVKLGRLADSLLVMIDCSPISVDAREDLFMNSRDRLSSGELRKAIEDLLEDVLHKHPGLRKLSNTRKEEEVAERLKDSKPLEEVIDSILKSSPTLATLFLRGTRLSQPHQAQASTSNNGQGGSGKGSQPFAGKPHPSYFNFSKHAKGHVLERNCELERRCRLTFETDAENKYFIRPDLPGKYHAEVIEGNATILDHSLTLHDGFAHWSLAFQDDIAVGETFVVQCQVYDDVIGEGFVNIAKLTIIPKSEGGSGEKSQSRKKGEGNKSDKGAEQPSGLQLPEIKKVKKDQWDKYKFDEFSACAVIQDESQDGNGEGIYTFYVNVDNLCLRTDIKGTNEDPSLVEAKFVYGNVLVGLALLHDNAKSSKQRKQKTGAPESSKETTIESVIAYTTRAMAPFLVPMINNLGALTAEDVLSAAQAGDDE